MTLLKMVIRYPCCKNCTAEHVASARIFGCYGLITFTPTVFVGWPFCCVLLLYALTEDLHINGAVALVDITKIIYSRDDLVECVSAPSCLVMFSVLFLLKEITGELYQGGKNFEWLYCKRDETAIREYLVWMDTMLFSEQREWVKNWNFSDLHK